MKFSESMPNYTAVLLHKRLFPCLIGLIGHLSTGTHTSSSSGALQFAFQVYSCAFQHSTPGSVHSKSVIARLCESVSSPAPKAFGQIRSKETTAALNTLLQLSKTFPEKMSPFSDVLLTMVDRLNLPDGKESLPELKDIRKLFTVLGYMALG